MANLTNNKKVLDFINETKALCQPDEIVWIDGSEAQLEALRAQAVEEKILIYHNHRALFRSFRNIKPIKRRSRRRIPRPQE